MPRYLIVTEPTAPGSPPTHRISPAAWPPARRAPTLIAACGTPSNFIATACGLTGTGFHRAVPPQRTLRLLPNKLLAADAAHA